MPTVTRQYLVEWFRPCAAGEPLGPTIERIDEVASRLSAHGRPVEQLVTIASPSDEVAFSLLVAADADTAELACRQAGCHTTRTTEAVVAYGPGAEL